MTATPFGCNTFTAPMLDEPGATVAIVGSTEDVGELRLAEQQTRDLFEHFRLALEAGGLGTWRWDMASGEIVWDHRLEALFGLSPGASTAASTRTCRCCTPTIERTCFAPSRTLSSPDRTTGSSIECCGPTERSTGSAVPAASRSTTTVRSPGRWAARWTSPIEWNRNWNCSGSRKRRRWRPRTSGCSVSDSNSSAAINEALNASSNAREVMVNMTRQAVPALGDWCTIHVLAPDGRSAPDVEVAHVDPAMVAYARELQERFPYDPTAPNGVPAVIRSGVTEFIPDISDDVIARMDLSDDARRLVDEARSAFGDHRGDEEARSGRRRSPVHQVSVRHGATPPTMWRWPKPSPGASPPASRTCASTSEQRDIARTLQLSLLPTTLPDLPGLDTAVRYWPHGEASEVGGDFYDMFALEQEGEFALVLGDVCGTGPAAAALTGLARHTIRDSAWHGDGPEGVLAALNRAVRRSGTNTFVTCVYATIDTTARDVALTVACGGHPLPIHVGARRADCSRSSPARCSGRSTTSTSIRRVAHAGARRCRRVPHRRSDRCATAARPRR